MFAIVRALGVRIKDADRDLHLFVDYADRFGKIRIIRDDDKLIAVLAESVYKHVRRDVDIRAFLFNLYHLRGIGSAGRWRNKAHPGLAL